MAFTSLARKRARIRASQVPEETPASGSQVPGELLAVSGEGVRVNAGDGQVLVTDAALAEAEGRDLWALLTEMPSPCVLGRGYEPEVL